MSSQAVQTKGGTVYKSTTPASTTPAVELPANFDPVYYLEVNPDVKAAGVDAKQHYLQHGYKEGRQYTRPQNPYGSLSPEQKMATDVGRQMGLLSANEVATGGLLESRLNQYGGTVRQQYNTNLAKAQQDFQKAQTASAYTTDMDLQTLRNLGINMPATGQGQTMDALARNPDIVDRYIAERRKYQPDFQYTAPANVPANSALEAAKAEARKYVTDSGLAYDQFPEIDQELQRIYKSIPYGPSVDAKSYFDPNTAANTLSKIEGTRRTNYTNQFDNLLSEDYGSKLFSDTSDDSILDQILQEQYGTASNLINAQKKRGALTDAGYSGATADLERQKKEAGAKLQGIGGNVLSGYRGQITDLISKNRNKVSGYKLGQSPVDVNTYKSEVDTRGADLGKNLEGDIRSSVGNNSLFDPQRSLASGFQTQGAQNTSRSGILDVLAQREGERRQKRGVGSQGAF